MHQSLNDLLHIADGFLNRNFSDCKFNWLYTEDFITFEFLNREPDPDLDEDLAKGLHTTLEYTQHYFRALQTMIKNELFHSNQSNHQQLTDAVCMLDDWVKNTFSDGLSNTRINYASATSHGIKYFNLTSHDLISLRFIIDGVIKLLSELNSIDQEEILKFKYLSDPVKIRQISKNIQHIHAKLCHVSMLISLHYRNRLAQQSDKGISDRWRHLSEEFNEISNQCLKLSSDCDMHLSALKALQLSPLFASDQQKAIQSYARFVEEFKELLKLCAALHQNFRGDSRLRFENFPLAWAFYQAERGISRDTQKWTMLLCIAILSLFFINFFNLYYVPRWLTDLRIESTVVDTVRNVYLAPDLLTRSVPAFILSLPFIWLAWFAAKHCNVATYLKYEYTYRTSIAATYSNYAEENSSADPEVKKEALKHLFTPTTSSWDNREPSTPYESFFSVFKGRTARKVLKSVFKNGVDSLTEFVNSLTGLISKAEDNSDKKKKSKSKRKAKSVCANDRSPSTQENTEPDSTPKPSSEKNAQAMTKDSRSESKPQQEQDSGHDSSVKPDMSVDPQGDSPDA